MKILLILMLSLFVVSVNAQEDQTLGLDLVIDSLNIDPFPAQPGRRDRPAADGRSRGRLRRLEPDLVAHGRGGRRRPRAGGAAAGDRTAGLSVRRWGAAKGSGRSPC